MAQGADVIFQNADAAGLGGFQAAREGGFALAIRANASQHDAAPGVVPGSAVIDMPPALLTVARTVRDRAPLPGVFALGAETGAVRFVVNPALEDRTSQPARHRLDSTWTAMASVRWQMPVPR
jgi:basic membrane lipoprotein Med (substrate-binding protein (PBP1-ABC) superfamily)